MEGAADALCSLPAGEGVTGQGGPHAEGCGRDGAASRRLVFWEVAAKGFHHKP